MQVLPELGYLKSREIDVLASRAAPADIARTAHELGCRSVAFTYNDPTIFWEYAADVADACHDQGIKAVAVTAGYMCPEPRAEFYRRVDAANVDLKAFTEDFIARFASVTCATSWTPWPTCGTRRMCGWRSPPC